jgi:conjugative transfer signal peptidase TraF
MPIGIWVLAAGATRAGRGDAVSICLPDQAARTAITRGYIEAGACPNGAEPLVKPVAAIGGDQVTISAAGIGVNSTQIADTAPRTRDDAGRVLHPMQPGSYRVAPDELWLLSGHDPRSFDSRYFGPIPLANVVGVVYPLWVLR